MNLRVTDNSVNAKSLAGISAQRSRLNILQERISTGKKINRPSDDPVGAEAVINLRTSQTEIEQFKRNAGIANQKLTAADNSLTDYENVLTRLKTLISQGVSDNTAQQSKNALATELETLRGRILNISNSKNGDEYLFGGTRQNAPPFDPATSTAASASTTAQYIQIEPGANPIAVGVTAETIFADSTSTIFADLSSAVNALRGTGNQTADKTTLQNTLARLGVYTDLTSVAHVRVGVNMNYTETAQEQLTGSSQSINERAASIETADFAETALELTSTQNSLNATLQTVAQNRRSLFDFLG